MNTQTKTTYTPGPWHVGMKPGPIIYGGKGEQIADLRAHWLEDREHVENVRLIASAPELLDAIKRVRYAFYVDGTSKALRVAFEGTKEIVAKAEGRI